MKNKTKSVAANRKSAAAKTKKFRSSVEATSPAMMAHLKKAKEDFLNPPNFLFGRDITATQKEHDEIRGTLENQTKDSVGNLTSALSDIAEAVDCAHIRLYAIEKELRAKFGVLEPEGRETDDTNKCDTSSISGQLHRILSGCHRTNGMLNTLYHFQQEEI